MALNDVLTLMIEDFDPKVFYDGQDQIDREAMTAFYGNQSSYFDKEEPEDVEESFRDAYVGWFESEEDFAVHLSDCVIDTRELVWPLNCIDWREAAREMLYDGFWTDNGYYFRSL